MGLYVQAETLTYYNKTLYIRCTTVIIVMLLAAQIDGLKLKEDDCEARE